MKKLLCISMIVSLLLCGCSGTDAAQDSVVTAEPVESAAVEAAIEVEPSSLFTDRDLASDYDTEKAVTIALNGDTAVCESDAVQINASTVTICDEGLYILSGILQDGMIIVDADKSDKVQVVLDGADITSSTSAPIYVLQADKVFLTSAAGTVNTLRNGGSFETIDENTVDAAVFSKEDLTINGTGSIVINSPAGHGVVSKDELTVAGGSLEITAAGHGLEGKDNICLTQTALTIEAGKDGIHSENEDDTALGFVYVDSGYFSITAEGDGISAASALDILDGTFNITTGGGSDNAASQASADWGMMPGGMGGKSGNPMDSGMDGQHGVRPASDMTAPLPEDDSTSLKALKAGAGLTVSGGSFTIDAADDALHSNGNIAVSGGTFTVATGDDGIHADGALVVTGGQIDVTKSYEGLEGTTIDVTGGEINLVCTDDGINAAGGTDQSGMAGPRGGDMFMVNENCYITISGGTLYLNASGDGIDSNGALTISGGRVEVCGPVSGDTAVLDYASTGTISGGTFIGTGAYMMAQTFSNVENQGIIAVSMADQSAGTTVTLTDVNGNEVLFCQPKHDFAIAILSSPEIVKGQTYTLQIGDHSAVFEAS